MPSQIASTESIANTAARGIIRTCVAARQALAPSPPMVPQQGPPSSGPPPPCWPPLLLSPPLLVLLRTRWPPHCVLSASGGSHLQGLRTRLPNTHMAHSLRLLHVWDPVSLSQLEGSTLAPCSKTLNSPLPHPAFCLPCRYPLLVCCNLTHRVYPVSPC